MAKTEAATEATMAEKAATAALAILMGLSGSSSCATAPEKIEPQPVAAVQFSEDDVREAASQLERWCSDNTWRGFKNCIYAVDTIWRYAVNTGNEALLPKNAREAFDYIKKGVAKGKFDREGIYDAEGSLLPLTLMHRFYGNLKPNDPLLDCTFYTTLPGGKSKMPEYSHCKKFRDGVLVPDGRETVRRMLEEGYSGVYKLPTSGKGATFRQPMRPNQRSNLPPGRR